ncbi:MAG: SH3 domain-containing protein [Pseudomonadota bacterium]
MKQLVIAVLAAAVLWTAPVAQAQTVRAMPVDEGTSNAGFKAYRDAFLSAVVRRDIDAILAMTDADVHLSFGGHSGHADFREMMTVSPERIAEEYQHEIPRMREDYWRALEDVLRMGGRFEDGGTSFAAPYTDTVTPPESYDPYLTFFVIGRSVALRERPIRWGKLIARLDHDIVTVLEGGEGTTYMRVRLADGRTGFVHRDYLRSQVDYRAAFELDGTDWKLVRFIAGD